ncbi:MAG: M13 family metallopeptidase [Rikenellaceae bacterium]
MKKILLIASIAFMASCAEDNTPKGVPAIDLANFDNSIAPQADFYEYATGGWQSANPLKAEYARYGAFDVLRENNEIRLNDLFAEMATSQSEKGSVEQKISDLYKMGLDSVRLNVEGVTPVKADIDRIMAINSREGILDMIAEMHLSVTSPFFGTGVGADLVNSNENVYKMSQRGLGMGNRDYYLDAENSEIKAAYVKYIENVFALTSLENPAKGAASVLKIEDALALAMSSNVELRDVEANYNPITKADFLKKYKGIDWERYFNATGVPSFEKLVIGQPKAISQVVKLISTASIEDLRYYLAAHYISSSASYMNDDIYAASFDFFGRTMTGSEEPKARWKRAMSYPSSVLGEAVGEIYVEKYFPAEDKARMVTLVANLRKALSQHIDALEWMSDETKVKAQAKLNTFVVKIGYPDTWKDYSSLNVDPSKSYWENAKVIKEWYSRDNYADLNKPVDRTEWHMSPQTVNAYYNPTTNEICFPAAILQPPFYNPSADDAVNYGAIGVVIGHEMTHGFDDQGRQFDAEGNMNNWWTEADSEAFQKRADVLIAQYDAIEVLPGLNANGALSLGENIADQGGLRVAHTAYINTLGGVTPEPIDGFTSEQRFYLGYANLWGQNVREAEIARLTKVDVHSLGKWRVNAALRNLEGFYAAFDIKEGDAMYMPESERVVIW